MPPVFSALDDSAVIDISHESLMRVWRGCGAGWKKRPNRRASTAGCTKRPVCTRRSARTFTTIPIYRLRSPGGKPADPIPPGRASMAAGSTRRWRSSTQAVRPPTARRRNARPPASASSSTSGSSPRLRPGLRLFKRFAGGLAVALCIAVALTIWALKLRQEAKRQEAAANQQRRVAQEKEQSERDARHEAELSRQAESLQRKNAESSRSRASPR